MSKISNTALHEHLILYLNYSTWTEHKDVRYVKYSTYCTICTAIHKYFPRKCEQRDKDQDRFASLQWDLEWNQQLDQFQPISTLHIKPQNFYLRNKWVIIAVYMPRPDSPFLWQIQFCHCKMNIM